MTRLQWINPEEYDFSCTLLFERFQIRYILEQSEPRFRRDLGIALKYNPAVAWYFAHRCPEMASAVEALTAAAPETDASTLRQVECRVLGHVEDFVIYTTPEKMATNCPFIYGWDKARLLELAAFPGKRVLDVGSGSGRLAFAAAQQAAEVYASEPVETLREYLRAEARRRNVGNLRVVDGMCDALPYPDSTFDIVMSGHVVGDDLDRELAELERVVKSGGWLLDCPGDQAEETGNSALANRGWEDLPYVGSFGAVIHRYRKQVIK